MLFGHHQMLVISSDEVPASLGTSRTEPNGFNRRFCSEQSQLKPSLVAHRRQAGPFCSAVGVNRNLESIPLPTTTERKERPMSPPEPKRNPGSDLVEGSQTTLPSEASPDRGLETPIARCGVG
jgi:hypothetical protein